MKLILLFVSTNISYIMNWVNICEDSSKLIGGKLSLAVQYCDAQIISRAEILDGKSSKN